MSADHVVINVETNRSLGVFSGAVPRQGEVICELDTPRRWWVERVEWEMDFAIRGARAVVSVRLMGAGSDVPATPTPGGGVLRG